MSPGASKSDGKRPTGLGEVPPRLRAVLMAVPVRNEAGLKWETGERGIITIIHDKDLKRWERWLMKRVGGSPIVRRRLDKYGSDIWRLCDGRHTVAEICSEMDRRYKEDIEPVLTRVSGFLRILLARNLVLLKSEKVAPARTGEKKNGDQRAKDRGKAASVGEGSVGASAGRRIPNRGKGMKKEERRE